MTLDPSEWGKLNAGQRFRILADDVGRALSLANLRLYELAVLWHLIEKSWGASREKRGQTTWPDAWPVMPRLGHLATTMGVRRDRLYDAKARLIASRILIETPDGLLINKDADQWIFPETGRPRLWPQAIHYALDARTRSKAQPRPTEVVQDAPRKGGNMPHKSGASHASTCPTEVVQDAPHRRGSMPHGSGASHIEDRAPGDLEREKERYVVRDVTSREEVVSSPTWEEEHKATVNLARKKLGKEVAERVQAAGEDIVRSVKGPHVETASDAFRIYRAAIVEIWRQIKAEPEKEIHNVHAFALTVAKKFAVRGIPPEPVSIDGKAMAEATGSGRKKVTREQQIAEAAKLLESRRAAQDQHGGA